MNPVCMLVIINVNETLSNHYRNITVFISGKNFRKLQVVGFTLVQLNHYQNITIAVDAINVNC
jgi:dissimilatory sulfite reductase (desulfoviridin) alpha/beta subunit